MSSTGGTGRRYPYDVKIKAIQVEVIKARPAIEWIIALVRPELRQAVHEGSTQERTQRFRKNFSEKWKTSRSLRTRDL